MEGYQLLGVKDPEVLAVDMCADIIRLDIGSSLGLLKHWQLFLVYGTAHLSSAVR